MALAELCPKCPERVHRSTCRRCREARAGNGRRKHPVLDLKEPPVYYSRESGDRGGTVFIATDRFDGNKPEHVQQLERAITTQLDI